MVQNVHVSFEEGKGSCCMWTQDNAHANGNLSVLRKDKLSSMGKEKEEEERG